MAKGNRKFAGFIITQALIFLIVFIGIFKGVQLSGDHVQALAFLIGGVYVFFVGGNVGEWFASSRKMAPEKPAPAAETK